MKKINSEKKLFFYISMFILVVILTAALIEMGLRAGALFVSPRLGLPSTSGTQKVILCLGDSNTYGVFYSQEEAYPGQLQRILEKRTPGRYHVLNLGLPGTNSSQIATHLQDWLDEYHPQSVVVCVGINNYWNVADSGKPTRAKGTVRWLYGLRLYRLFRLIKDRFEPPPSLPDDTGRSELQRTLLNKGKDGVEHRDEKTGELLIAHEGNIREVSRTHTEAGDLLRRNLMTMLTVTKKHNIELILLTYAAFPLPGGDPIYYQRHSLLNT